MPVPGIVAGYDNEADIIPLDQVDPSCLFQAYVGYVEQEWEGYENREKDGNRMYKPIGLPSTKLIFPYATNPEYKYFSTTILLGKLSGEVTAYLLNQDTDEWGYYNGIMHMPTSSSANRELGEYKNLEIEITDLEEIT